MSALVDDGGARSGAEVGLDIGDLIADDVADVPSPRNKAQHSGDTTQNKYDHAFADVALHRIPEQLKLLQAITLSL